MRDLSNLRQLYLDGNNLTELPPELEYLGRLEWVSVNSSKIGGRYQRGWAVSPNLTRLELYGNKFVGPVPERLSNLTALTSLNLERNQLSGQIPADVLALMASIDELSLGRNQFIGDVPADRTSAVGATIGGAPGGGGPIARSAADRVGQVAGQTSPPADRAAPQPDGDRAVLAAFFEATGGSNWRNSTNWLSDHPISTWYGVTAGGGRVTELSLAQNNLTGQLPAGLGNLTQLRGLDLYGNELTGPIPTELGALTNLERLSLDENRLTGPIPPGVGNLTRLRLVDLANNELTGPIPPELGRLTNLERLYLNVQPAHWHEFRPAWVVSAAAAVPCI